MGSEAEAPGATTALRQVRAGLRRAWAARHPYAHVARQLTRLFPHSNSIVYRLETPNRLGPVGHTLSPDSTRWSSIKHYERILQLRRYLFEGTDPFENCPVQTERLYAAHPRDLDRLRQELLSHNDLWYQLRVAHYCGGRCVGYAGVFRNRDAREFDQSENARLAHVTDVLSEVLLAVALLERPTLSVAALGQVLSDLGQPVLVLNSRNNVAYANCAARSSPLQPDALLSRSPAAPARSVDVEGESFTVFFPDLTTPPHPDHAHADLNARLARVRDRFRLTNRQTQVLHQLVLGKSNKEIATILGCAAGTIEIHITALLRKLSADSRGPLLARFWLEL